MPSHEESMVVKMTILDQYQSEIVQLISVFHFATSQLTCSNVLYVLTVLHLHFLCRMNKEDLFICPTLNDLFNITLEKSTTKKRFKKNSLANSYSHFFLP